MGDTTVAAYRCLVLIVLVSIVVRLPTALVTESLHLKSIANATCSFEWTYHRNKFGYMVSVESALVDNRLYSLIYHGICEPLLHTIIFVITLVFNWSVANNRFYNLLCSV